jgi:hypothetical protein
MAALRSWKTGRCKLYARLASVTWAPLSTSPLKLDTRNNRGFGNPMSGFVFAGSSVGSPDICGGVVRVDYAPQLTPITIRCRCHRGLADEPIAPIDADMRLVAEHRRGDLWQRHAVGPIADLAPDLHGPARIDVLFVGLVRLPLHARF